MAAIRALRVELPLEDARRIAELLVDSVVRGQREDIPLRDRMLEAIRTERNRQRPMRGPRLVETA